eukprot:7277508-Pyramimonas_sp.AAC.1
METDTSPRLSPASALKACRHTTSEAPLLAPAAQKSRGWLTSQRCANDRRARPQRRYQLGNTPMGRKPP